MSYPDLEDLDLSDVETFIDAAQAHGEDSEPDHEAGDLQDVLRAVWEVLPAGARTTLAASQAFEDVLEWGSSKPQGTPGIETFLKAAKAHGEDSDPDHEVGDLQDLLRAAWPLMTPEQNAEMLKAPGVRNALVGAYCYDEAEVDERVGLAGEATPGPA